jgi:hypothetical protein
MTHRAARVAVILAAVLAFTSFNPPPAQALWRWEIQDYYTGGCGSTLTHVGYWERDCDGTITQSGTLAGKWKVVRWMNCVTYEEGTDYYEWCGSWVPRNVNNFPDDCGC